MNDCQYQNYSDRLIFTAEWYQVEASMTRTFFLYYFPIDGSVEIYDVKTKKGFLRRTKVPGITETDFYIGAKLNIFGRQIDIIDYGDSLTKNKLAAKRAKTFFMIKPDAINKMGEIIRIVTSTGFSINQCRMVQLTQAESSEFYCNKTGQAILPFLMEHIMSGSVLSMELVGDDIIEQLKRMVGPENPNHAKEQAAESLRATYGEDHIKNAVHCSESAEESNRELNFFFSNANGRKLVTTETLKRCTLGVIKPHAIKEGKLGNILTAIVECGFKITAMKMVYVDRVNCQEFYEVYKGVVPEYVQMVLQLSNGPCIAMEITGNSAEIQNTHEAFRKLCGPTDPEIARQLRPNTIRARFGESKVLNAIHCTDLEEDCLLEVEYFFKILE